MMDELKPCPFCGAKRFLTDTHGEVKGNREELPWTAETSCDCGAFMFAGGKTEKDAVSKMTKAWNRRVNGDAELVRHGHWKQSYEGHDDRFTYTCSACGYQEHDNFTKHYRFCPHCGAKMDEKENKQ